MAQHTHTLTFEGHRLALRFEGIASLMPNTETLDRALPRMKHALEGINQLHLTAEQLADLLHQAVQQARQAGELPSISLVLMYQTCIRFLKGILSDHPEYKKAAIGFLMTKCPEAAS